MKTSLDFSERQCIKSLRTRHRILRKLDDLRDEYFQDMVESIHIPSGAGDASH